MDPSGQGNSPVLEVPLGNDPVNKIDPTGLADRPAIFKLADKAWDYYK